VRPFSAKKKKVLYFFFVIAFFLSGWAASMIRILGEAKIHGMHFILYNFIPRKARREWPLFKKMYRKGALVILIHSNHHR
jgi:hypothetical protein